MSRDLKYFAGYAAWRELRYNAHKRQNQSARKNRTDNEYLSGYVGWSAFFIVMSLLSLVWFALFTGAPFFIFLGLIWVGVTWYCTYMGFREQYRKNHS